MPTNTELKKLPVTSDLVAISKSKQVTQSVRFLQSRQNVLAKYPSFDDFIYDLAADPQPGELSGFEHHMSVVRNAVLNVLRTNSIFVGSSVIEELVFDAFWAASTGQDPLAVLFEVVRDAGLHEPGLLIFPLHSTGILGSALLAPSLTACGEAT